MQVCVCVQCDLACEGIGRGEGEGGRGLMGMHDDSHVIG
jgi:hypothetical protein